uniref:ABC-transporter N-terminal domain-containing protein n=1 Tax=Oryza meridionalis TaxID=40149 RepID=A0A0E0E1M4_9ORYZ
MWWSTDNGVLLRSRASSRGEEDDDDEEALRWTALEKLPTYDRVRRAVLPVVDERRALLERLVRVAEDDNERFLLKLKERIDRRVLVGIDIPTIEVRFEHLEAEVAGLPTVLNSMTNNLEGAENALGILPNKKQTMPILHVVSGSVKHRRMTLPLGPPRSGKTTLLLALAGRLGKDIKVSNKFSLLILQ